MTGCQPTLWEPVLERTGWVNTQPAQCSGRVAWAHALRCLAEFFSMAATPVLSAGQLVPVFQMQLFSDFFPFLSLFFSPLPVSPGITRPANYLETFGASGGIVTKILTKIEIVNCSSLFIRELKMMSLQGLLGTTPLLWPCCSVYGILVL